jgi:hypothetical protein
MRADTSARSQLGSDDESDPNGISSRQAGADLAESRDRGDRDRDEPDDSRDLGDTTRKMTRVELCRRGDRQQPSASVHDQSLASDVTTDKR